MFFFKFHLVIEKASVFESVIEREKERHREKERERKREREAGRMTEKVLSINSLLTVPLWT